MTAPIRINTSLIIRKAVREDLPALMVLLKALFSIEEDFVFDEEKLRRGLSLMIDGYGRHRCMLVAEFAGEVVGMCSVQVLISTAEGREAALVEDVVVREDCRGRGIGATLMDALGKWAGERGISRMQLLADRQNKVGADFYKRQGWHTTQLICLRKLLNE